MEFPADAITNINVIDGFSTIYWRIYTEERSSEDNGQPDKYSVLKYLGRLKDIEIKLRNQDCLVSTHKRFCLWVFSATPEFESLRVVSQNAPADLTKLTIGPTTIKVSASGQVTAAELIRTLSREPVSPEHQSHWVSNLPAIFGDTENRALALFAAFISSVASAMGMQLIRRYNAVPLGTRSFFTPVHDNFYDNPFIANGDPTAVPALTNLHVDLSPVGKVIISLRTVHQGGISCLQDAGFNPGAVDASSNIDVWLAPNGTVARLVSLNGDQSRMFARRQPVNDAASRAAMESKQRIWKSTVLEWLSNVGLPVTSVDDERWVEVEVFEPFYSTYAAEYTRQVEDVPSSSPLRRILWPSRYCFTRTASKNALDIDTIDGLPKELDDPLQFVEDWLNAPKPRVEKSLHFAHQSNLNKDMPTPRVDIPESLESLARASQYPDLQPAGLFYPTPPDGALVPGAMYNTDASGVEPPELPSSQAPMDNSARKKGEQNKTRSGSEGTSSVLASNTLGVASGHYDANGDEDLFNDKDFGTRDITDADFNFFDDPNSNSLDEPVVNAEPNELTVPEPSDAEKPQAESPSESVIEEHREDQVLNTPSDAKSEAQPAVDTSARPPTYGISAEEKSLITVPPLSPVEIQKIISSNVQSQRLKHELDSIKGRLNSRRGSRYNAVPFQGDLIASDQKYAASGRFFFSQMSREKSEPKVMNEIPTIGIPPARKSRSIAQTEPATPGLQAPSSLPPQQNRLLSSSDSSEESSYDSDDDYSERGASPNRLTGIKRKRPVSEAGQSATSSTDKLTPDVNETVTREDSSVFLASFFSILIDWSLEGYFSFRKGGPSPVLVQKDNLTQVAQLMVDQLTQSSLQHRIDGSNPVPDLEGDTIPLRTFLEDINITGGIERLDMKSYVSILDASEAAVPKQSSDRKSGSGWISKLPPPHVKVRRGRDFLELLPPATLFWETFGLEPVNGPKDISAYCIHPPQAREGAEAFLDRLGLLYSSCNMGKHSRGGKSKDFESGLCVWNVTLGEAGYLQTMQKLKALCGKLGAALSKASPSRGNFVVYVINPYQHAAALADICAAFVHLFQKYIDELDKTKSQSKIQISDVTLQVVPLSFVMSSTSIVAPPQSEYVSLALEVYGRCPPSDAKTGTMGCAPPILLADPLPKSIDFKLIPDRTSPFQEEKCLHLAISQSLDKRWITAAWSDNTGSFQLALSYCARARGTDVGSRLAEGKIRREIWDTTREIIERKQGRWKVFLVQTEPLSRWEIDEWKNCVKRYNRSPSSPVDLAIFSANIAPGLRLELPSNPVHPSVVSPHSTIAAAGTPAGVLSPDPQGGNSSAVSSAGGVPGGSEADEGTVLIDVSDESWGVILSRRQNNSQYMTLYQPSLASGYLLRRPRNGVHDGQGVVTMKLDLLDMLIENPSQAVSHQKLLRNVLGMYRDLGTLARIKGTRHVQRNALPWHIATAVRGQELLSYVL